MNKSELSNVFEEQIDIDKNKFENVLKMLFKKPHDFCYINNQNNQIYSNFDQLIIE